MKEAHTGRALQWAVGRAPEPGVRVCLGRLILCTLSESFELAKPHSAHLSNGEYIKAYLVNCEN